MCLLSYIPRGFALIFFKLLCSYKAAASSTHARTLTHKQDCVSWGKCILACVCAGIDFSVVQYADRTAIESSSVLMTALSFSPRVTIIRAYVFAC